MGNLDDMIKEMRVQGIRLSASLESAFKRVDRADFVLPAYRAAAYDNQPLPIGFGQTISQPYTVAFMLGLLNVRPGQKILEIGSGSGWQTALLARLVGEKGKVVALERVKELAGMTVKNLAAYPKLARSCLVVCADGSEGFKDKAPYHAVVAAASAKEIPAAWKTQVKIGGRIVAPVGESLVKLTKIGADKFIEEIHSGFVFVPLI